jgi:uncharacterized protein (DUF1810 family)
MDTVMVATDDPHDLKRFVAAQDADGTYDRAVAELRAGRKVTHWMWFVFPQIAGLGHSAMARRYAIASVDEAEAYMRHPTLGARLIETATIVAGLEGVGARDVLGEVDARKLRSSMTLFRVAAPDQPVFTVVLERWFAGMTDEATEGLLC